jgi:hypothetical protein
MRVAYLLKAANSWPFTRSRRAHILASSRIDRLHPDPIVSLGIDKVEAASRAFNDARERGIAQAIFLLPVSV